jgi:hypothetical protein
MLILHVVTGVENISWCIYMLTMYNFGCVINTPNGIFPGKLLLKIIEVKQ